VSSRCESDSPGAWTDVLPWPILRAASGSAVALRLDTVRQAAQRLRDQACGTIRAEHLGLTIEAEVVIGDTVPILLREATDAVLLVLGFTGPGDMLPLVYDLDALEQDSAALLGSRLRGRPSSTRTSR